MNRIPRLIALVIALALGLTVATGTLVPKRADAVVVGLTVVSGGLATGLMIGAGAYVAATGFVVAMDQRPHYGLPLLMLGLILNENDRQVIRNVHWDYNADLDQKIAIGLYSLSEKEVIANDLSRLPNQAPVLVDLAGLNRGQAIEKIRSASGLQPVTADYLLQINGVVN